MSNLHSVVINMSKKVNIEQLKEYIFLPILLFFLIYLNQDLSVFSILNFVIILIFGYIATISDIKTKKVSNKLLKNMLLSWAIFITVVVFFDIELAVKNVYFGLVGFIFTAIMLILIYILSKKGLGGADVKFMSIAGLYLGVDYVLSSLLLGSIFAATAAGILILLKKISKKDTIPLVPFLYAGIVINLLFC